MPAGGSSSLVTFGARSRGQDQADGPDWGRSWETLPQESQFGFSSGFPNSDVRVLIKNSILSLLLSTFALEGEKVLPTRTPGAIDYGSRLYKGALGRRGKRTLVPRGRRS